MVDCHMHAVLDAVDWKQALGRHRTQVDIPWVRSVLDAYRKAGFTWLRDGGDRWGVGKTARSLAPEYGITYRTPLAPLCKKGHYGSFIGRTWADLDEYRQLVLEMKAQGADFIKIMISGLMDFDRFGVLTEEGLPAGEIAELIAIAHDAGMSVMAHANGDSTVIAAAKAGVDSVEHGAYLQEGALDAMGAAGAVWVPTVSTVGNLRGKGRFQEQAVQAILESAGRNIQAFAAAGGLLAPGSDAGAWAVPHGCTTEYALLAEFIGADHSAVLEKGICVLQHKF